MRTFDFYGENIVVSDGQENYIRLRLEMEKIASELKDQFVSQYKNKYRSMDQVVADVFNMGEGYILQAATWCIDLMGKNHIYNYDTQRFIKKWGILSMEIWINACDRIANSYTSIIVNGQLCASVKQWQQNYRSKWLGTAFSALPVVGRMPVDWSTGREYVSTGDSIAPDMYPNLNAMFNSEKPLNVLADAIYTAVAGMHQSLVRVLMEESDQPLEGLDDDLLRDYPVIFSNIIQGIVSPEDIVPQAALLVKTYPFDKELYIYMFDHYGDKEGSLSQMTVYFGLGDFMEAYKIQAVEERLDKIDFTDLEGLRAAKKETGEFCENSHIPAKDYISAIDQIIEKLEECQRVVDGVAYEDNDLAQKARQDLTALFDRLQGMGVNGHMEEIRKVMEDFKDCSCQTWEKYRAYLEECLKRGDIRFRTVQNIVFDTKEIAEKTRQECLDFEKLMEKTCGSLQDIHVLENAARTMNPQISPLYIQLVGAMSDVWNRQEIMYSSKALYRPENRAKYTEIWFEALELEQSGRLLGLANEAYSRWFETMSRDFLNVKGNVYENVFQANAAYYKVLDHAITYFKYINEKNGAKKGFFASLKNNMTGLVAEKYQEDFAWLTQGGARCMPADTPEEGSGLESRYGAMEQTFNSRLAQIGALTKMVHNAHLTQDETLDLKALMCPDRQISREDIVSAMNPVVKYKPLTLKNCKGLSENNDRNVCQNCGAVLPEDAVFCVRCGARRADR